MSVANLIWIGPLAVILSAALGWAACALLTAGRLADESKHPGHIELVPAWEQAPRWWFADISEALERAQHDLIWCGGSPSFAQDGEARLGWEKGPQRTIAMLAEVHNRMRKALVVNAAAEDVLTERQRQVDEEGWTAEHDDRLAAGDLARAACAYAVPDVNAAGARWFWPNWDLAWWKPKDRRRNLVRATALLLAEIDRLDRLAKRLDLAEQCVQGVPS